MEVVDIVYRFYHGESVYFEAHGVLWMGVVIKDYGESLLVSINSPLKVGIGYISANRVTKSNGKTVK